jgi:hypothetical protein
MTKILKLLEAYGRTHIAWMGLPPVGPMEDVVRVAPRTKNYVPMVKLPYKECNHHFIALTWQELTCVYCSKKVIR